MHTEQYKLWVCDRNGWRLSAISPAKDELIRLGNMVYSAMEIMEVNRRSDYGKGLTLSGGNIKDKKRRW